MQATSSPLCLQSSSHVVSEAPTLSCSLLSWDISKSAVPLVSNYKLLFSVGKSNLQYCLGWTFNLFIKSVFHPQGRYIIPARTVSPVSRQRICGCFCAVVSIAALPPVKEKFILTSNLNAPCCCLNISQANLHR